MRRLFSLLLLVCLLMCMAYVTAAETAFSLLPTREYGGVTYEARPPAETSTILLIGYDHNNDGQAVELHGYSGGGQADLLLLVVLDHKADMVRLLQIDRDTIAQVRVTDVMGQQHTRNNLQICLAHAYGDTRERNNANTVLAVETLLGIADTDDGAGIDYYIAMDISGIGRLNDLLGGVTVTLEDNLTAIDPQMQKGSTLTLTGEQAEIFCRARRGLETPTNAARMGRQRQYMIAAAEQLKTMLKEDPGFAEKLLNEMGVVYDRTGQISEDPFTFADQTAGIPSGETQGKWLMTSGSKQEITAAIALAATYSVNDVETLPGEYSVDNVTGYIRYDVENGAALSWALGALYRDMR